MKLIIQLITILILGGSVAYAQTLDDYFKIAAENNPGIQSKYKEFEAALEKIPQVSSLTDPQLSFGYFISPVETRVGQQRARFSLTQMFPWFGTLTAQGDAASLLAEAKYQDFIDARNNLYFRVSAAYFPLFELNQWKQIEEENIGILESYKSIANSKFKHGTGSMVDVLRVDIMLNDAITNLSILEQKEKPLRTTFNKLLNRDEEQEIIIADPLVVEPLPENFRKDSLLNDHPLLNALDLKIEASEANELAATKQGYPKFGVGIDYVIVGERPDQTMADNGRDVLMPMVTMSIPIFRSKYRSAVKEAQIMQESYSFQKEEVENTLSTGYESARFAVQQQQELLWLYEQQIRESNQALNLLFSAYGNSGKEFEEVLRMQQQLLKYEKMQATAEVQYHIAVAKINYLTAKNYENE
ncbi:MAG: TolC family protein [Bacteroidales bacterium]